MSTTAAQTKRSFAEAAPKDLPRLICVGYVAEVGTGKESKSGQYVVQPIVIEPMDAGRKITVNFLYRPEQLVEGFRPESYYTMVDEAGNRIVDDEAANKVISVYRRNIAARGSVSVLQGLAGSDEAFNTLADSLIKSTIDEVTIEGVETALRTFFDTNVDTRTGEPVTFMYELRQANTKTDEVDAETGKQIWIKENKYDLDSVGYVSKDALKRAAKRAERSEGRTKLTFQGCPF